MSFRRLFGLTVYDGRREYTEPESVPLENRNYRQEPMVFEELPWSWYVSRKTGESVRAFKMDIPLRLLGVPEGDGCAAHDVPEGGYLLHDMEIAWVLSPEDFEREYVATVELLNSQKKPSKKTAA